MKTFDELYAAVKDLPIVDWHNHLDLTAVAEGRPLGSLHEAWVKADPYKHRAMRPARDERAPPRGRRPGGRLRGHARAGRSRRRRRVPERTGAE